MRPGKRPCNEYGKKMNTTKNQDETTPPALSRKAFIKDSAAYAVGAAVLSASLAAAPEKAGGADADRYRRGWEMLGKIDGEAGGRVIESLRDIAPDLGRYVIEFPFGDVYSRGVLSLREREIATVAALSAMGNARPQLKVHVHGALNVGCSRQEVVEICIQMAVYAGFPAALNAVFAAREVFRERDESGITDSPATPR